MGYDNNVYVQIGNIMLIALAAKNRDSDREFAKANTRKACRLQMLRWSRRAALSADLMTAFAFILGCGTAYARKRSGVRARRMLWAQPFLGDAGRHGVRSVSHPRQFRLCRGPREKARRRPRGGSAVPHTRRRS